MADYKDFSSMPPEEEKLFVPFEEHSQKSASKARNIGRGVGLGLLVILSIIIMSFPKPKKHNLGPVEEEGSANVIRGEGGGTEAKPESGAEAAAPAATPEPAAAN